MRDRLADYFHRLFEQIAIFGVANGIGRGAEHFDIEFVEHAGVFEFDGEIESGLTAERCEQTVGAFLLDDVRQELERQRLHIDFMRGIDVCHDRCRIRIDEHDRKTFVAECAACLRSGVIEFRRLTYHNRSGADHEYFLHCFVFRHR